MGVHHRLSAEQPSAGQPSSQTIVDVHTHVYPPSYIDLLASRTTVPYVHRPSDGSDPRLIILPSDDDQSKPQSQRGRPIDASYSNWDRKIEFMDLHGISASVVSLANPWLDFLPAEDALEVATKINDDLNSACTNSSNRLYAFGCLPLSAPAPQIVQEIGRLKNDLSHIKGVIMGTTGLGKGLDDPEMELVWSALAELGVMVFLHPHYGLPDAAFGGSDTITRSGHVLPLALGFPLETTIAVARMYLAGVFDRHKQLKMLLAHSGGALPFLAGRIESCVQHERDFVANGGDKQGPQRDIWEVLRTNIWLDAVIYGSVGLKAAIDATNVDRLMFGTDHPFFPPLNGTGRWTSVDSNLTAVNGVEDTLEKHARGQILAGNAIRVLGLDLKTDTQ